MSKASSALAAGSTPVGGLVSVPRSGAFAALLLAEQRLVRAQQDAARTLPRPVRRFCRQLVSAHPLHDVTLALWLALPFFLFANRRWDLFWLLSINLFAAFMLSWWVGGTAPAELDPSLKPLPRLSPSAFPCVEAQLAACLLTYLAGWHRSASAVAACAAAMAALLATRLFALTHFPSQLFGSAAAGALSVPALRRIAARLWNAPLTPQVHVGGAIFVASVIVAYLGYHIESNDIPIMRVPRAEYARVLGEIIASSESSSTARAAAGGGGGVVRQRAPAPAGDPPKGLSFPPAGPRPGGASGGSSARSSARGSSAPTPPPAGPAGGGGAGLSYPPAGYFPPAGPPSSFPPPGGAGGGSSSARSYPPAGPSPADSARSGLSYPPAGSAAGSGLNLGSGGGGPRDSLYWLLREANK